MSIHCPERDILLRFVEATLSESEASEVVAHLNSCAACSQFVEQAEREPDEAMLISLRELQGMDGQTHDRDTVQQDYADTPFPQNIGQYEILQKIGQGGMGVVYRAVHPHLKREVALKVIRDSHLSDPDSQNRFVQEMRAIGRLSHPNIVQATDAGIDGHLFFLVMELLDGEDLGACVARNGIMPVTQAVDCIRQAAEGLAFAHKAGYVHRDIKPSNLFLTQDGVIKILDLGIARPVDGTSNDGTTRAGQLVGSPEFMAPEQFRGETVDVRSDIFSLGQTLHFLLTGRFQGNDAADIPRPLQPVLARMTAGIREQRFETMADVLTELNRVGIEKSKVRTVAITLVVSVACVLAIAMLFWSGTSKPPDMQNQASVETAGTEEPPVSTNENFDEPWLSVQEVSTHFGVSNDTVYRWIANNDMPAQRAGRLWRFKKSEVDAWFKAGGAKPKTVRESGSPP